MLRKIKKWFKNFFKRPEPTIPVVKSPREINTEGVLLIKYFEGFSKEAYRCAAGVWTVGYGTIIFPNGVPVKKGDKVSMAEATEFLKYDVLKTASIVNGFLEKHSIEMNDNEFSALVSICYNCGTGILTQSNRSLHNAVISKDRKEITKAMLLYVRGGGKVLPGLVKRRQAEVELFLK